MCKGCDKQAEKDAAMRKSIEDAQKSTEVPITRLAINCPGCGLMRLLPTGLQIDEEFSLVPCLKCNIPFRGRFVGNGVSEIV